MAHDCSPPPDDPQWTSKTGSDELTGRTFLSTLKRDALPMGGATPKNFELSAFGEGDAKAADDGSCAGSC